MGKPLSIDLRSRLVAAVAGGLSRRSAAERFGVSAASAVRWVQAVATAGSVQAKPQGGDTRSHRIEAFSSVILAAVAAQKDISLVELADLLRTEHGASFGASTVWRCLDRHGMTFKKNGARRRAGAARRCSPAPGLVRSPARP
jgi:transposase